MLYQQIIYSCACDSCGNKWTESNSSLVGYTTKESMLDVVSCDDSWHTYKEGDELKHYCHECWDWANDVPRNKLEGLPLDQSASLWWLSQPPHVRETFKGMSEEQIVKLYKRQTNHGGQGDNSQENT